MIWIVVKEVSVGKWEDFIVIGIYQQQWLKHDSSFMNDSINFLAPLSIAFEIISLNLSLKYEISCEPMQVLEKCHNGMYSKKEMAFTNHL